MTDIERNRRVQARYDELDHAGKHGHYETLFRIVREEVDRALIARPVLPERVTATWRDIATLPLDGTLVLFVTRNGSMCIAPAVNSETLPSSEQRRILDSNGEWPWAGWLPTHWMPLPPAPDAHLTMRGSEGQEADDAKRT